VADKPADAAPPKSKKLLLIVGVLVVVLALAGGGAFFFISKQRAAAADEGEQEAVVHAEAGGPPTYLPLDNMVVNLADPGGEKVAQIGITLEIEDAKISEQLKAYMPAIRNGILMVLAHKTSAELLERKGKEALAAEIMRETVRPLGIEIEAPEAEPEAAAADDAAADDADAPKPKKKKKKAAKPAVENPVKHVHFSNFIIQ